MRTKGEKITIAAILCLLGIFQIVTGIIARNYLRISLGAVILVASSLAMVRRSRAR